MNRHRLPGGPGWLDMGRRRRRAGSRLAAALLGAGASVLSAPVGAEPDLRFVERPYVLYAQAYLYRQGEVHQQFRDDRNEGTWFFGRLGVTGAGASESADLRFAVEPACT